jgi:serine/threonine-protein kinase
MPPASPLPRTAEAWTRISRWFDTARDLGADELEPWLVQLAQDHPDEVQGLRQMLAAHGERTAHDWLERGPKVAAAAEVAAPGLAPGARVGPWVLGELLGSGGMASVWRAVRADALPAREVALKIPQLPRAGTAYAQHLAERFAREREILSRLAHPHIAPLYAAGVAPDGTPWLAMECVEGQAIDAWCDARRLPLAERVALYGQVLDAVQHAHSRGVIHRDIKPSNILVTADGQVRLLDFGIARLLDDAAGPGVGGASALTQVAGRLMTPAYAAPEQVRGETPTTATDIYALGVVLFELLAGARPYVTQLDTPAQLELAIAEGHLQRASAALTAAAAQLRGGSLRRVAATLRRDLDTILAKALQQDARERYASAAEFAADLRRWAAGEPVLAQPGSAVYRLRRFVARHRVPVLAGSGAVLVLVVALVVALRQAERADRERDAALAMRGRFSAVTFFMTDQLMASALSAQPLGAAATLERADAAARLAFADDPDALAQALLFIGGQRRSFESAARGEQTLAEALKVVRDPSLRALLECDRGLALYAMGRVDDALASVQRGVDDAAVSPGTRASCMDYQVLLLNGRGDLGAALRTHEAAAVLHRDAPDTTRVAQERSLMILAYLRAMNGSGDDPDPTFQAALQRLQASGREATLPGQELRTRWATARLASGDARGALPLIEANRRAAEGRPSAQVLASHWRAEAVAREALGHDDAALADFTAALAAARTAGDARLQASALCLAVPALLRRDALARAEAQLREGLQTLAALASAGSGPLDEPTRGCTMAQAELALAQSMPATARLALQPLLDEPRLAAHHRAAALVLDARAALAAGDAAAALKQADAALVLAQRMQGPRAASYRSAAAHAARAEALAALGDTVAASAARAAAAVQYAGSVDATHAARR